MSNPSAGGGSLSSPEATGRLRARVNAIHIEEDNIKGRLKPEQSVAFVQNAEFREKVLEAYRAREMVDAKYQTAKARKEQYAARDREIQEMVNRKQENINRTHEVTIRKHKAQLDHWQKELSKTGTGKDDLVKRTALRRNIRIAEDDIDKANEQHSEDLAQVLREKTEMIKQENRKPLPELNQEIRSLEDQLDGMDISELAGNPPKYKALDTLSPKPEGKAPKKEPEEVVAQSPRSPGKKYLKAMEEAEKRKNEAPYVPLTKEQIAEGNAREKERQEANEVRRAAEEKAKRAEVSAVYNAKHSAWLAKITGKKNPKP